MSILARLVGGPSHGQLFIQETPTTTWVESLEPDDDCPSYYRHTHYDPDTGEHIFEWTRT